MLKDINFPIISYDSNEEFYDIRDIFHVNKISPIVIAGPCAVENKEYFQMAAKFLSENGVKFLRGGIYKPRSSPYEFQGLRKEGLEITKEISKKYNMTLVSEILDFNDFELMKDYVDIFQIGSRNMQNFELLKQIGRSKKPVILKRGMGNRIEEFILAAEYIALEGNRNILMCERGIRTYETEVRNMLDIACIALVKKYTKLPIIADISHSLGRKDIMDVVAKSVLALGADGFMVEVHPFPSQAMSDNNQQLDFLEYTNTINPIIKIQK